MTGRQAGAVLDPTISPSKDNSQLAGYDYDRGFNVFILQITSVDKKLGYIKIYFTIYSSSNCLFITYNSSYFRGKAADRLMPLPV